MPKYLEQASKIKENIKVLSSGVHQQLISRYYEFGSTSMSLKEQNVWIWVLGNSFVSVSMLRLS